MPSSRRCAPGANDNVVRWESGVFSTLTPSETQAPLQKALLVCVLDTWDLPLAAV